MVSYDSILHVCERHTANCSTAFPKVFSRDLYVYQCISTHIRHKTQQESSGLHKSWPTLVHVHIATEDLETLHPGATGLCFIIMVEQPQTHATGLVPEKLNHLN